MYGMRIGLIPDHKYLTGEIGLILHQWHEHRYLLLLAAVLSGLALFIYFKWRLPSERLASSSAAGTREYDTAEKAGWLGETSKSTTQAEAEDERSEKGETDKSTAMQFSNVSVRSLSGPRRIKGSKVNRKRMHEPFASRRLQPLVFFSSLTGSTENYAQSLLRKLQISLKDYSSAVLEPQIHDLSYIDYDDFYVTPPKSHKSEQHVQYFYLLLLPSYNIDTTLDNFLGHLQETHHDFRIDTAPLSDLAGYSVFGFGDKEGWSTEEEGFCSQAIEVDKWMAKLTGSRRAYPLGLGDVKSDCGRRLDEWRDGVVNALLDIAADGGLGEGVIGSGNAVESEEEDVHEAAKMKMARKTEARSPAKGRRPQKLFTVDDLEDLGGKAIPSSESRSPLPVDFTNSTLASTARQAPKPMVPVSSPTHTSLTKQGYTIIGTHSGVKICRWTKSALRGRGSCYKYSFYGIKSHLCMETTPSLSCSNKCVFCWRHGTNPVGTTWRWQVDPPKMIFEGAKEGHYKKIKMMKGVPGVRAERFHDAMQIKHCALSLVGEPIFYPHINEFLALLHEEKISSFLVCNAQHPDHLAALKPVTQLYVSIDASNAESLRKIDRPLHRDYWQRFLRCLDILREKRFRMRTVFRLTLVKGFNIDDEVEGYAELVARGLPCFVEIKGVTYCGTSSSASAGLTMQNVPFYDEITTFVEALNAALDRRGLEYGIAAEHAHSCCVLIASKRFYVREKWHTLIDYEKFFECLEAGTEFSPEDYMGPPTPEWAAWGKGGFDPADERVDRKGRPKIEEIR